MAINLCSLTIDDYASVLLKLMPNGLAWNTSAESNQAKILASYAAGMAAYNDAMCLLLAETDPRNSTQLLAEWGIMLRLPRNCGAYAWSSIQAEQQAALYAAYTQQGGASAAYLQARLNALNLGVFTITESLHYFVSGDPCGTPLISGDASLFYVSGAYNPDDYDYLTCVLDEIKPAHTDYLFI